MALTPPGLALVPVLLAFMEIGGGTSSTQIMVVVGKNGKSELHCNYCDKPIVLASNQFQF